MNLQILPNKIIKISDQKDLSVKVKNSRIITRYGGNNSKNKEKWMPNKSDTPG